MKKILVATARNLEGNMDSKYPGIVKALGNLGYDVWYTGIKGGNIFLCNETNEINIGHIAFAKIPQLYRATRFQALFKALITIAKGNYDFDFCFLRCTSTIGYFGKALKKLKKAGVKIIVEIPTHPCRGEYKFDKRKLRKPLYKIMEHIEEKNAKYVDLYALIGKRDTEYLGRPAVNIENGVDMDSIPAKKLSAESNEIHFIAVAKIARWHGYDRFIEGLNIYITKGGTKKAILHLVGPCADSLMVQYKTLITKYSLEENVVFHGPMHGEELSLLFDKCDIAVASLGSHRKNLHISSELKIREYMARGIPFIYATENYAINPEWNYCLKVSDNDEPIDIFKTIEFAKTIMNETGITERIRKDCAEKMTWESQMRLLLEYFKELKRGDSKL